MCSKSLNNIMIQNVQSIKDVNENKILQKDTEYPNCIPIGDGENCW